MRPGGASGLCPVHEKRAKADPQQSHYYEAVNAVLAACRIKGWDAIVESRDDKFHLATIKVLKQFDYESVSGLVHLTVDTGVKYRIERTSFYNYGLKDLLDAITYKFDELDWLEKSGANAEKKKQQEQATGLIKQREQTVATLIMTVLANFDQAARQLRRRHDNRAPFEIKDEYDVQDLLHTLLRAYFADVRPEESTPSYAGASSRLDFLLKEEKSVIEVKFATVTLRDKQIGEQLIIDIKRYQAHPDCSALYCLVYDPNGSIRNPAGLERDISGRQGDLTVTVKVVPN